jgi:hypothetical protein
MSDFESAKWAKADEPRALAWLEAPITHVGALDAERFWKRPQIESALANPVKQLTRGLGIVGMPVRQCGKKHLCVRSAVTTG